MPTALSLSFSGDIAILSLDIPDKRVNLLSAAVRQELAEHLESLANRPGTTGLIITSTKPGSFLAGADLRELASRWDQPAEVTQQLCISGRAIYQRLASLPFPTIAAINGTCLGGGLELALWCDARIATDSTTTNSPAAEIGLPETKLGLIPGWGGTALLPRLVGLPQAASIISGGLSQSPAACLSIGLVDALAAPGELLAAATQWIGQVHTAGDLAARRIKRLAPVELPEAERDFVRFTLAAEPSSTEPSLTRAGHAAVDLLVRTSAQPLEKALAAEAELFSELWGSPENRGLINTFFLTDHNKRDAGLDAPAQSIKEVASCGVMGVGIMGAGIAATSLRRGVPTSIADADVTAIDRMAPVILNDASFSKSFRGPDPARIVELAPLLQSARSDSQLAHCDLVIEAVVENLDVKRSLLARLETVLAPTAVLASNTSTLPIAKLAAGLARPEQFCGMHFFNPVRHMKLVEVIRSDKTSDATVATAVAFAKRIGKMPIVVKDGPGFLVNRVLSPYLNEALQLFTDGAEIDQIDAAAIRFGMPLGPFQLYDMVGLDTALYAGRTMWEAFPERVLASPIIPALVKAGRLGQKKEVGFYNYAGKTKSPRVDGRTREIALQYRRKEKSFDPATLQDRLLFPMLLEATRLLEEGRARDPRDVDLGVIFGLGFPANRGGLLYWADTIGASEILRRLEPLAHIGPRMQPTALLESMARSGKKFYDGISPAASTSAPA